MVTKTKGKKGKITINISGKLDMTNLMDKVNESLLEQFRNRGSF